MISQIYEASIFSKNFDEIDFSATARNILPIALSAIALAGAVACIEPIIGVVVILTGLVMTVAYVIFFAILDIQLSDSSSVGDVEDSSEDEVDPIEGGGPVNWLEITAIIGDAPVLDVSAHSCYERSEDLSFLRSEDVPDRLMQGVFKGSRFIAIKLKVEGYYYHWDVEAEGFVIDQSKKIVDTIMMEVVQEKEAEDDRVVVRSKLVPQALGISKQMQRCSHPDPERLQTKLQDLIQKKEPLIIQAGLIYYFHF